MRKILPFFSYLFHPVFIPLYTVIAFFNLDDTFLSVSEMVVIVIQMVIITIFIPIAFFFLLQSVGMIDTVMASNVKQRRIPLALQALVFFLLTFQSITVDRIPELYYFFMGAIFSILVAITFSFANVKISLHTMSLTSMTVFIMSLSYYNQENSLMLIAILIASIGVVATSRLYMNAHTLTEIFLGFAAGLLPQMLMWFFWL